VVFFDPTCGTSGQNQNHLLQNFLRSMDNQWDNKHLVGIAVKALAANPDQVIFTLPIYFFSLLIH